MALFLLFAAVFSSRAVGRDLELGNVRRLHCPGRAVKTVLTIAPCGNAFGLICSLADFAKAGMTEQDICEMHEQIVKQAIADPKVKEQK